MKISLDKNDLGRASLVKQENPKLDDFQIPLAALHQAEEIIYYSPLGRKIVLKSRNGTSQIELIDQEIAECHRILSEKK